MVSVLSPVKGIYHLNSFDLTSASHLNGPAGKEHRGRVVPGSIRGLRRVSMYKSTGLGNLESHPSKGGNDVS